MAQKILVVGGLAIVGSMLASAALDAFGIEEAEGFGMDDVVAGLVVGTTIVLGRRLF